MRAEAVGRRHKAHLSHESYVGWAFILPFVLLFAGVIIGPLIYSGYLSLFVSTLVSGQKFAWLANYIRVFEDSSFWRGFENVGLFLAVAVPLQLAVSLVLALLFDSGKVIGAKYARLAIFLPFAVPGVIATLMWGFMYGQSGGLINQLVTGAGLPSVNFFDSRWVLPAIMNITGWEYIGYNMVIFYTALRTVPRELVEAASLDGASRWRVAWNVKIAAIRGAILLVVIFAVIFSFQLFNEPQLLSPNAPTAIGTAFTPNLYAYNVAFTDQEVNYAAAIAFVLGLITVVPSLMLLKLFNKEAAAA